MNEEQKKHIIESLSQNIRMDNRKINEFREVELETGKIKTAEGSARVKIGETEVLAGIKLGLGAPYPDQPDEGTMSVNVELLPLSSPRFEAGPPGIEAVEIARVVDRGIRESHSIDTKELCIEVGEKIWMVSIDICTVNDAGNLIDASAIAALAALEDAVFPDYDKKENKVDYEKKTKNKLPLLKKPLPVTVYRVGKNFVVDPLREEEVVADARLTVATTTDGKLCALQKGGDAPLTIDEVDQMVALALEKAQELRKKLKI